MDIRKEKFWFFSTEGFSTDLPVQCRFIRTLQTKNNREAILVDCKGKIASYGTKYLVLVPKHEGVSFFHIVTEEDAVFAYVLNGSSYVDRNAIDLSAEAKLVIDWGGITGSRERAGEWQVSIRDVQTSRRDMQKHLRRSRKQ